MSESEYKKLVKIIESSSYIFFDDAEFLIKYLTDVKEGNRLNDFIEFNFLKSVILNFANNRMGVEKDSITNKFIDTIKLIKFMLPLGKETSNYDAIKNMIINSEGNFDLELYCLFPSLPIYHRIMYLINSEENKTYKSEIIGFIKSVAENSKNETKLEYYTISYINGLKTLTTSIEEYTKKKLEESAKECGKYPVDEKQLSLISGALEEYRAIHKKAENIQSRINEFSTTIKELTENSKKEINECSKEATNDLRREIDEATRDIISSLDEYLLELENTMKINSDQVFNEILEEATKKIKDIRVMAQGISVSANTELLRIRKASEDSVEELRHLLAENPNLKELMKDATTEAKINGALGVYSSSEVTSGTTILNHRYILPASQEIVVPNPLEIRKEPIPAFDERIPFEERFKKVMEEKEKRISEGEYYHQMIDEILVSVMENDYVNLWGPSGCGKTKLMSQVAELLGLEFEDNGKITDKASIIGYYDTLGRYRATHTFAALVYGRLLGLDEFDNGNANNQVILNNYYSKLREAVSNPEKEVYATFTPDMRVPVNVNFRLISAGNTNLSGENMLFSSRDKSDESVRQRMTSKRIDYDNKIEEKIMSEYPEWYKFFVEFRKACDSYASELNIPLAEGIITTSDAADIVKYINHNSKTLDTIMRDKFTQVKNSRYLKSIRDYMIQHYGITLVEKNPSNRIKNIKDVDEKELAKCLIYRCNIDGKYND